MSVNQEQVDHFIEETVIKSGIIQEIASGKRARERLVVLLLDVAR